jgi:phenylalanyl-tRNA synthetase alpha subunit
MYLPFVLYNLQQYGCLFYNLNIETGILFDLLNIIQNSNYNTEAYKNSRLFDWLNAANLSKYYPTFVQNGVNEGNFLQLTLQDYNKFNITQFNERKSLFQLIQTLKDNLQTGNNNINNNINSNMESNSNNNNNINNNIGSNFPFPFQKENHVFYFKPLNYN